MEGAGLTLSDFYGQTVPGRKKGDVSPTTSERASGSGVTEGMAENAPAMIWIGMVLFLVVLRVAWEKAK